MSRFHKRYLCCTVVVLILIFMVYYRFFGRYQIDQIVVSSDEFIAVAYVLEEDDENNHHANSDQKLLNLTDFRYKLQPKDSICPSTAEDLLGLFMSLFYASDKISQMEKKITEKLMKFV